MTPQHIADITARLAAATPGPWHPFNTDDEMCMNVFGVITGADDPCFDDGAEADPTVVAVTLLQTYHRVGHHSERHEYDANLIAHAPDDLAACLAHIATLEAIIQGDILQDSAAARALVVQGLRMAQHAIQTSPYWRSDDKRKECNVYADSVALIDAEISKLEG
jgi:hypothetical protein